jgi:peptidoglycan/xylan/chitin deacetylase (PgdA/CDA1 family)
VSTDRKPWFRRWHVELAVSLAHWCGLLRLLGLFRKYWGPKRLIILMYHRLVPAGGNAAVAGIEFDEPVPVDRFERHMKLLRWFGRPMALGDARRWLYDPRHRRGTAIAITFDDGYLDSLQLGLPVWQRFRVPITLFPAIRAVSGERPLWWDELAQVVGGLGLPGRDRAELARNLFHQFAALPASQRDAQIDQLARRDHNRPRDSNRLYVNWSELAELVQHGVEIGGHTVSHPRLPLEDDASVERELHECRAALRERTGQPVTCFAYPGGFFGERECQLLAAAGYTTAVTVEKGINHADTPPFQLRRIGLSWDDAHHLAFKLVFARWLYR